MRCGTITFNEMRMFDFSRPELRVWAKSDSEMQRFESCRPSQPVPVFYNKGLLSAGRRVS